MNTTKTKVQELQDNSKKYRKALKEIALMVKEDKLGIHRGRTELVMLLDEVGIHVGLSC